MAFVKFHGKASGSEAYSEPSRIYQTELFAKIVNGFQQLTIFAKSSILDVRLGSEYTPESRSKAFIVS